MAEYFQMLLRTQIFKCQRSPDRFRGIHFSGFLIRIVSEAILCLKLNWNTGEIRSDEEMKIVNIAISLQVFSNELPDNWLIRK